MTTNSRSYSRARLAIGALLGAGGGTAATFIILRLIDGEIASVDLATIASIFLIGLLFSMALHFPTMVSLLLALIVIGGYAPGLLRRELMLMILLAGIGAAAGIGMGLVATGFLGSSTPGRASDGASFPAYAATSMAIGGIILGLMLSRASHRLSR